MNYQMASHPSLTPHSCAHCQTIILDFTKINIQATGTQYQHRVNCSALVARTWLSHEVIKRGSETGCAFWTFLANIGPAEEGGNKDVQVDYLGYMISFRRGSSSIKLHLVRDEDDTAAAKHVRTRPVNVQTASTRSLELACEWLKDCLENHPGCRVEPSEQHCKPTRVVEIVQKGPDWKVRSYSPSEVIDYVALSYCWGGPQTNLTMSVKEQWKISIPWYELAQTIRDAIYVTSQLGFRYIWIDALCIVQDDLQDKMGEIAKMAQVYTAATLTIAASTAEAARIGFLQDRSITDFPGQVFRLPLRCENGSIGAVTLLRPPVQHRLLSEPLNGRGWTLQEWYLSSRILEFKKLQLKWSCSTASQDIGESRDRYVDGWMDEGEDTVPDLYVQDDACEAWRQLVYAYSLRKLTVATDRILAISGLAEVLHGVIGGEYWAGFWQNDLPYALMWKSTSMYTDHEDPTGGRLIERPKEYQGPSWSWISVNTIASYKTYRPPVEFRAQVLGCKVELADERAPYGAVVSASLNIRGRLRPALLSCFAMGSADQRKYQLLVTDLEEGRAYATVDALEPEFASNTGATIRVYLSEVLQCIEKGKDRDSTQFGDVILEGLILRKIEINLYSRIGTFGLYKVWKGEALSESNDWFLGYKFEDIIII